MYVYRMLNYGSEEKVFTVGFYDPSGEWNPESDHSSREEAANRVNFLNGGRKETIREIHVERRRESAGMLGIMAGMGCGGCRYPGGFSGIGSPRVGDPPGR